jgi:hypothetical protein
MRLERVTATGRAGRWDVPITAADIPYVIKQVAKCLRLAEECNDGEISAGLLELARAFADCARNLGADPDLIPAIQRRQQVEKLPARIPN